MNRRELGVRLFVAATTAALVVVAFSPGASQAEAAETRQTLPFKVELDPANPDRLPRGERAGQILGGQSFTALFEAHARWHYDLTVDSGLVQQLAVSVSGSGGPEGGYDRTLPPADASDVKVSWTATIDGPVSVTVSHLVPDPKTYDPKVLPEFQSARVSVTAVPYDDHANDAREATKISLDETISGLFELGNDQDAFSFFAEPGFDYRIDAGVGKVGYVTGTLWDVEDFGTVDPSNAKFFDLASVAPAGILIHGFNPGRSGLHHFVLRGAGNDVNAPYTVRVSRTRITTTVNTTDVEVDGTCDFYHCSLPEAIEASNDRVGVQTIAFSIPGDGIHRIYPQGFLLDLCARHGR